MTQSVIELSHCPQEANEKAYDIVPGFCTPLYTMPTSFRPLCFPLRDPSASFPWSLNLANVWRAITPRPRSTVTVCKGITSYMHSRRLC